MRRYLKIVILTLTMFSCGEENIQEEVINWEDKNSDPVPKLQNKSCDLENLKKCQNREVYICKPLEQNLRWTFNTLCSAEENCINGTCKPKGSNKIKKDCESGLESMCKLKSCEPSSEICDGKDNDCDGKTDEFFNVGKSCGIGMGICKRQGKTICNKKGNGTICSVKGEHPKDELCDNIDNDCDGRVDENLVKDCIDCIGVKHEKSLCVNGHWQKCPTPKKSSLTVKFPGSSKDCNWKNNNNLGPDKGARISARREQKVSLSLPESTTLCKMELSSNTKSFYYDDELMLNFNGFVLLESVNFSQHFNSVNGFKKYDWSKIKGKTHGNSGPFCTGKAKSCQIPGTQTSGKVAISFDDQTNQKLMFLAKKKGNYQLNLIITGDNDPGKDCKHKGLEIKVDYTFISP